MEQELRCTSFETFTLVKRAPGKLGPSDYAKQARNSMIMFDYIMKCKRRRSVYKEKNFENRVMIHVRKAIDPVAPTDTDRQILSKTIDKGNMSGCCSK